MNEYNEAMSGVEVNYAEEVDLNMTVRFVDGDELIADSAEEGSIIKA
jgi:hypothetical protein